MTKWKIATAVLAVVAVGFGAWAFSLQSDLDDKDAKIAAQQQQLDEQQDVATQVQDAASGAADDAQQALAELGQELEQVQGTATATQAEVQDAVDRAEQAAAEARASAGDAAERAQARADEATAKAEAAGACARGYLSALAGVLDAASITEGVERARSDIESLSGSCSDTLDAN
jgi:septal ring factor EnvC (AmiA/AmiB activator)